MIAPRESGAHNIVDVTYSQFWNIRYLYNGTKNSGCYSFLGVIWTVRLPDKLEPGLVYIVHR